MTVEGWWLDDAEELHRAPPRTFFIPPLERRQHLAPGDAVKLPFSFETADGEAGCERMWVEVVSVRDGTYRGLLMNEPQYIPSLRPGDRVWFEAKHVAAVDGPLPFDCDSHGFVSAILLHGDDDERPRIVYREAVRDRVNRGGTLSNGRIDSGWCLMTGDEADLESADAVTSSPLGWLAERYPELEPLFSLDPPAGEWAWDEETCRYVQSDAASP